MRSIYLDYNATTPIAPTVLDAMLPFLTEHYGNPSSQHALGRACHHAIEDAREQVAELIGARADEVIFTGGGTEANNLALKGVTESPSGYKGHIIISAVEHPAISEPAKFLRRMGCDVTVVPTDSYGRVDPDSVRRAIRDHTVLVSIMHANNEIGTVEPIREIAQHCRGREIVVHTDAAQSVGKIRTHVDELDVDLLSIAGHKLYAPKGVGALYVRRGTQIFPAIHGAGHEQGLRPGTENVAFIVGLGAACRLASRGLDDTQQRLAVLRDRLYSGLQQGIGSSLSFNGHPEWRLPNTLSVNFPQVTGADLLAQAVDILASTGAACHSGGTTRSATLTAIGLDPAVARGTVRLSLGWNTAIDEVDRAIEILVDSWHQLVGRT